MVIAIPNGNKRINPVVNQEANDSGEEEKLSKILSKMDGVGEVFVMIRYEENQQSFSKAKTVEGIVVLASGAHTRSVDAQITEVIQALFPIPAHKIKIVKMVKTEGS